MTPDVSPPSRPAASPMRRAGEPRARALHSHPSVMFRDTSVTDFDPTLPTASLPRAPRIAEGVREPEPLVAICFACRSVRDCAGAWAMEPPLERLLATTVTHVLCPTCLDRLYPEPGGGAPTPS